MADQLSSGMGNLSIDQPPSGPQMGGQGQMRRSYIPPHLRGKMGEAAPPMAGPPAGVNGLNNSAWAG